MIQFSDQNQSFALKVRRKEVPLRFVLGIVQRNGMGMFLYELGLVTGKGLAGCLVRSN